jgi:hypothetical protein
MCQRRPPMSETAILLLTIRLELPGKKVSSGYETPQHSGHRLAVYHRWLWPCAPAYPGNVHRDHTRICRTSPSRLAPPSLPAIFRPCRLSVHSRTARDIDCERQPSIKGAVRMGKNAAGYAADIRRCNQQVPPSSHEAVREAPGISEPDASRRGECRYHRDVDRLCFPDSFGPLEGLSPTNQAWVDTLTHTGVSTLDHKLPS